MARYNNILILRCLQAFHPGTGSGIGIIDNPIQRAVSTDLPIFWDSGLKGSLKERTRHEIEENTMTSDEHVLLFGSDIGEGNSPATGLFTEAHTLVFPVRSARGLFTWLTCPYILNRLFSTNLPGFDLQRDGFPDPDNTFTALIGNHPDPEFIPAVAKKCSDNVVRSGIEEFILTIKRSENYTGVAKRIADMIYPEKADTYYWKNHMINNLLVVSNDFFKHIAFFDTEIRTRNRIGPSGVTENTGLFVSEYLPEQTVLFAFSGLIDSRPQNARLNAILNRERTLFAGGNITIGKGMINLHLI